MFFDPRLSRAGRSVPRTRHKTGRTLQEIWSASDADLWHGSGYTEGDSHAVDEADNEMDLEEDNASTWTDGEGVEDGESQARFWMHTSYPWYSSTWRDSHTADTTSTLVPSGDSSWYSPSTSSDAASTSTPLYDQGNESSTTADVHFQASVTEYPDWPPTSSPARDPWITPTSIEQLSTRETLSPFGGQASTASSTHSLSHQSSRSTYRVSSSATASGASLTSTPTDMKSVPSVTNTAAVIPHIVHVDGLSPAQRAGTIVGVVIGVAIIGMLIALSVFAYKHGGGMRGAILRSSSRSSVDHRGAAANADNAPRDLEDATTWTGRKGDWEDVDIRDTSQDDTKENEEKLSPRPPELHFDPALPLPPIVLEGIRRSTIT